MNNSNVPLHRVKLEQTLTELEMKIGWEKVGELLNIRFSPIKRVLNQV